MVEVPVNNKFKLWEKVMVALLLFIGVSFFIDQDKLDDIFVNPPPWNADAVDSRYEQANRIDVAKDAFVLKRSLYDFAYCQMSIGSFNFYDILKNCTYTAGSNSSDLWSVKMVNGYYYWHTKNKNEEIKYKYNIDGPSSVLFEDGSIGDLNNDGKDDAVAVLKLNNEEDEPIRSIVVLVQGQDREMEQYAFFIMRNGERVENISTYNGIISVDVMVRSKNDSRSLVYDTYRIKI